MHIHTTAATPAGDSLAGFQAAQTAAALRRARELSSAAARLKARASAGTGEEDTVTFASLMANHPATQAQTIAAAAARPGDEFPSDDIASGITPAPERNPSPAASDTHPFPLATQEPSRASPTLSGETGSNSKDWLRPVSFWA